MKRIVFFCDGTSNRLDAARPTHVARLAQATLSSDAKGIDQVILYQQGVGTSRGSNRLARSTDRLLGGAFGWGLDDNLLESYRHLVLNYEIGDEIYIFGFSRGAYTARSLAGLIRKAGIPPRDRVGRIADAIAHYRMQGEENSPRYAPSMRFRADFSPDTATSPEDQAWRRDQGLPAGHLLRIRYLGIWDTVGALGLPSVFGQFAKWTNSKYNFHDAELSSSVQAARHAVAVDERRKFYPPTLWGNLVRLNSVSAPETPYKQLWFPGNHSVIGGSGQVPELSAFTQAWIAEGAEEAGLSFAPDLLDQLRSQANAEVSVDAATAKAGVFGLGGILLADRDGPKQLKELSQATLSRVLNVPKYRPGALRHVLKGLLSKFWAAAMRSQNCCEIE